MEASILTNLATHRWRSGQSIPRNPCSDPAPTPWKADHCQKTIQNPNDK